MEIRLGDSILNDYACDMSECVCAIVVVDSFHIYRWKHRPTNTKALELFDLNSHNRIRSALR